MLSVLNGLKEAKFKGVSFLVKNSSIRFGQKTVMHRYPNADRTEVEEMGIDEDTFDLEIYVHGYNLLSKRKKLKETLKKGGVGKLIHPYESQIDCKVVSATLIDSDAELGIARFSVVFQQTTIKPNPLETKNTKGAILRAVDACLSFVEGTFDTVTTAYSDTKLFAADKLANVADTFDKAQNLTYKVADKTNELNKGILDFKRDIINLAQAPRDLARALTSLFNNINFIADNDFEQIRILKTFFDFGSTDRVYQNNTLERMEKKKFADTLNNAMLVNSLALAYGTAGSINYDNNETLETVRNTLEDQYELIKENIEPDVLEYLDEARLSTLNYLDGLDVANVIQVDVKKTGALLLSHTYYGNIEKYDEIVALNNIHDPNFISGQVKLLNE